MRTARLLTTALICSTVTAGVVAGTAGPASAVAASNTYVCTFPVVGEVEVPLTLEAVDLPASLPTGVPVDPDTLGLEGVLEIPALVTLLMLLDYGLDAVTGTTSGLALDLGGVPVPVDLGSGPEGLVLGEALDLPVDGGNGGFVPGLPGEVPLRLPESFTLGLTGGIAPGVLSAPCVLSEEEQQEGPAEVTSVRVTKQKASMKGRVLTKPVLKGKRAKVHVAVWDEVNKGAPGTVVATAFGREVGRGTLQGGAMRIKLAKLGVGSWRVKLVYLGTETIDTASKTVRVKVVKRPKKR